MDDHHPGGIKMERRTEHLSSGAITSSGSLPGRLPERYQPVPAGRNISATHAALSATRAMATCATVGQAAGSRSDCHPRGQVCPVMGSRPYRGTADADGR